MVILYLTFLKKHLPPRPPSPLSLACCIAKMTSENTLLMVDLFLNSINEALKIGIAPLSDNQVPALALGEYVILKIPCYSNERMDQTLLSIKIQKIIVDAALEIISLIASGPDDSLRSNASYEELLKLLFAGFMLPNYHPSSQGSNMAWIERDFGKNLPLLTEQQASSLVRSKDFRLINAGTECFLQSFDISIFYLFRQGYFCFCNLN